MNYALNFLLMKKLSTLFVLLLCMGATGLQAQVADSMSRSYFLAICGNWQGQLTYLDYTSNKPFTMPAFVTVSPTADSNSFVLYTRYSEEPKANAADTLSLKNNGRFINDERVISRTKTLSGHWEIITENAGVEGNENRQAIFRHIYTIGPNEFIRRKDVRFTDEAHWFTRYTYSFTRQHEH